jgi:hypothetical protein
MNDKKFYLTQMFSLDLIFVRDFYEIVTVYFSLLKTFQLTNLKVQVQLKLSRTSLLILFKFYSSRFWLSNIYILILILTLT